MFSKISKMSAIAFCALSLCACSGDDDDAGSGGTSAGGSGGSGATGGSGGGSGGSDASAGTTVAITVTEFTVTAAPGTAPAGDVTFDITNTGTEDHEFVVVKTDIPHDQLPMEDGGGIDETAAGVEVIDEVEDIAPGATEHLSVNLPAANYVLICNRVEVEDGGEVESHYMNGMHTPFKTQ